MGADRVADAQDMLNLAPMGSRSTGNPYGLQRSGLSRAECLRGLNVIRTLSNPMSFRGFPVLIRSRERGRRQLNAWFGLLARVEIESGI